MPQRQKMAKKEEINGINLLNITASYSSFSVLLINVFALCKHMIYVAFLMQQHMCKWSSLTKLVNNWKCIHVHNLGAFLVWKEWEEQKCHSAVCLCQNEMSCGGTWWCGLRGWRDGIFILSLHHNVALKIRGDQTERQFLTSYSLCMIISRRLRYKRVRLRIIAIKGRWGRLNILDPNPWKCDLLQGVKLQIRFIIFMLRLVFG